MFKQLDEIGTGERGVFRRSSTSARLLPLQTLPPLGKLAKRLLPRSPADQDWAYRVFKFQSVDLLWDFFFTRECIALIKPGSLLLIRLDLAYWLTSAEKPTTRDSKISQSWKIEPLKIKERKAKVSSLEGSLDLGAGDLGKVIKWRRKPDSRRPGTAPEEGSVDADRAFGISVFGKTKDRVPPGGH